MDDSVSQQHQKSLRKPRHRLVPQPQSTTFKR